MSSCLIIAGEKSGEEHAMSFLPELMSDYPKLKFFGVGGDDFKKLGVQLIYHHNDFSSMGFSEVISKVPFYFRALKNIESEVVKRKTQYAILIDFQGFNYRLASKLKKLGVKVFYYVAPQAWAWKEWRAKGISRNVHTLFAILPFEKKWFMDRGVKNIISIPHPSWRKYANLIDKNKQLVKSDKIKICLLPGSRKSEIIQLLPVFLEVIKKLKYQGYNIETYLVRINSLNHLYNNIESIDYVFNDECLPKVLQKSDMALAASGTVTLITGLFRVPTIVCYKSSLLNAFIFYDVIKYKGFISLTNLILGHEIFPELTQENASAPIIIKKMKKLLDNQDYYNNVIKELSQLSVLMSGENINVAKYIGDFVEDHK